jgi:hypothetical protein
MRGSHINPKLSAWNQAYGNYDFNCTPIAPPGIHVIVHEKPALRQSWAAHGVDGWYIGPALDSYRCYCTYIWLTQLERISDTLAWFPTKIPMPIADSTTMIQSCLREILQCLCNPSPGSALAPLAASESAKLCLLAELFAPPAPTQPAPNDPLILAPVLRVPVPPLATPDEDRATSEGACTSHCTGRPSEGARGRHCTTPVPLHATPAIQDLPPSTHTISHCPANGQPPFSTFVSTDMGCLTLAQKVHKVLTNTTSPPSDNPTPPSHPAHIDNPSLPIAYLALAKFLQLDPHQLEMLNGETAYKAIHPDTGRDIKYPGLLRSSDGLLWEESCAEEAGRLAQGYKQAKGTNTIHFIRHDQLPKGCQATYLQNVVADRPQKEQPRRV